MGVCQRYLRLFWRTQKGIQASPSRKALGNVTQNDVDDGDSLLMAVKWLHSCSKYRVHVDFRFGFFKICGFKKKTVYLLLQTACWWWLFEDGNFESAFYFMPSHTRTWQPYVFAGQTRLFSCCRKSAYFQICFWRQIRIVSTLSPCF